jgi:hypothetical protein
VGDRDSLEDDTRHWHEMLASLSGHIGDALAAHLKARPPAPARTLTVARSAPDVKAGF